MTTDKLEGLSAVIFIIVASLWGLGMMDNLNVIFKEKERNWKYILLLPFFWLPFIARMQKGKITNDHR